MGEESHGRAVWRVDLAEAGTCQLKHYVYRAVIGRQQRAASAAAGMTSGPDGSSCRGRPPGSTVKRMWDAR